MDAEGRIAGTERDQHASAVLQACSVDLKTSGKLDAAAIDGLFSTAPASRATLDELQSSQVVSVG
jgi:hypothetical protein